MGHTIIKPKRDEDFYVVYSSVVDAPITWGTREFLERDYEHAVADRFARADETGTSNLNGWDGWDEDRFMIREGWDWDTLPDDVWCAYIARADLRRFCEAIGADGFWNPPADMPIEWEYTEEDS